MSSTILAAIILALTPALVWLEIRERRRRRELIRSLKHSAEDRELTIQRADAFRPDRQFWRYLFAGMAMQGALANSSIDPSTKNQEVAGASVDMADALLAELERDEGKGEGRSHAKRP